ncbi:MAG: HmuY family protein [Gemmatimonadaceae bacterium]|nr:HmuY family protein [Gemmatimonadaceae bacterium]
MFSNRSVDLFSTAGRAMRRAAGRVAVVAVSVTAIACAESEADPTGPGSGTPEAAINEIVTGGPLNASGTDTLVYFSFAQGALVPKSADWDIALRRFELRLSSAAIGGSATKSVLGVSLDNSKTLTDAEVLALSATTTRTAFDQIRAAQIPDASQFQADRLTENRQGYLNLGGIPTANSAAFWKVRLASGSFAAVRVSAISFTPQFQVASVTIETRLQDAAGLGAPRTLVVTPNGQLVTLNLTTSSVVATATGCNWDVQFNPAPNQLAFSVNTACNVGTYPGTNTPTFATATSASDAPQYAAFLSQLVGPIPNSVTDKGAPFRYNLTGNDRLHPSFNTYLVKSGDRVYKLQVVDYYSNTGAAGFPTLRYARLQ